MDTRGKERLSGAESGFRGENLCRSIDIVRAWCGDGGKETGFDGERLSIDTLVVPPCVFGNCLSC